MFEIKSTYFNTAYLGPTPLLARERILERLDRGLDPESYENNQWFEFADRVRERLAHLAGCAPINVAFSTSVSELVSHVANGLNLGKNDEVVLMNGDYPSLILPWLVLKELRGFELRLLELDTFLNPTKLCKELSAKTKFVACSHVMFNTGIQLPVSEIGALCRSKEILYMSDVSQSFGGMTLPPASLNCDILVGVCYKWLLGPYGSAWGYFSERALAKIPRTHASWLNSLHSKSRENLLKYSVDTFPGARRFDRGEAPSFLITAGLEGSLDLLTQVGLEKIERQNRKLTDYFLQHLPKGFELASPYELRSNIVCIKPGTKDPVRLKEILAQHQIIASLRERNLRFAFHFFNNEEQVNRTLKVLEESR